MSAITLCKTCNKTISANAHQCPHCGDPDPTNKKQIKKLLKVLLFKDNILGLFKGIMMLSVMVLCIILNYGTPGI